MYGLVFEIVEEFVIEKQGLDVWRAVKAKAGCVMEDHAFLRRSYYEDSEIVDIIAAAANILGVSVPDILETFGHYVIRHHYVNGYNDLLRAQGTTLRTWLSNLNAMHDHVQKSFPGEKFSAPIYWCNDCDEVEGSILLHYYSLRGTLLVPMTVGIVEELATFQFGVEVKMTQLALQGESGSEFTSWRITATDPTQKWKLSPSASLSAPGIDFSKIQMPDKCPFSGKDLSSVKKTGDVCPVSHGALVSVDGVSLSAPSVPRKTLGLSLTQIKAIFNFHVLVDSNFIVLQTGNDLPAVLDMEESHFLGKHIGKFLDITRPVLGSSWNWKSLKKLADQNFSMAPVSCGDLRKRVSMADTLIKFKASMIDMGSGGEVMFALSPDANNVVELRKMRLTLTDLPLHGCQRDAVFLGEHIVQESDKAHKLDKLSKKLGHEKKLSNTLLYNLLPKEVADDLRSGKAVEPKQYDNVTLFFSDIQGFTSICDKVDPWSVIDMLNQLYSIMDFLASHFALYKIETIGDAYMCCSGLPVKDENHAENIANFAIAVSECVKHVLSPVDGTPIKLRIGIHTGSCTAGVVGTLTPHYCLFGDMVNTTARHEQTGMAGKIQCSSELFGRLKHFSKLDKEQYAFSPRGLVTMKGKKKTYTYWVEGGTTENEHAGSEAIRALSAQVGEMLKKKSWKKRRYFRRSGSLRDEDSQSVSSDGTHRTASSEMSDASELSLSDGLNRAPSPVLSSGDNSHAISLVDESNRERNLDDLDGTSDTEDDSTIIATENGLRKLVWDKAFTREDLVANVHLLLSPLLKLCIFESMGNFPDTIDLLDGQLYGFIDRISKAFKSHNPYHNFRHTVHLLHWASHIFETVQDGGAGHTGCVDTNPWYRFTLGLVALARDCKHSGVSDGQLKVECHMVSEIYGSDSCQTKYGISYCLDVLADDFHELNDEIVWHCPRFVHLMRKVPLSADPVAVFEKVMMQSSDESPREVLRRTEATMSLVLRLATLGHFVLEENHFVMWNEAAFAEKRLASLAKRGSNPLPNWHKHCVIFIKQDVLPLVQQCERVLPKTVCLRDSVELNLKSFEAQGRLWADNDIFPRRSNHAGAQQPANTTSTLDVFA